MLIGLLGAGWLWFVMSQHGIGLSPDSAGYLAVAGNLLEGKGFICYSGEPFGAQPPLYPLAVATLSFLLGLDLKTSALFLNLLIIVFATFISGNLTFLITNSFPISLFVCFSIIFGIPTFQTFVYAWSEPTFILFLSVAFFYMLKFIDYEDKKYLLVSSFFISLACMTRYVGIFALISFLSLLIFKAKEDIVKKRNEIYTFLFISSFPLYLWGMRNYILSRTFFGRSGNPLHSFSEHSLGFVNAVTSWFIFPVNYFQNKTLLFLVAFLLIFILLVIGVKEITNLKVLSLVVFIFLYLLLLFIACVSTHQNLIDNRLLSPIFIPLGIVLIDFFYRRIYLQLMDKISKRVRPWLVVLGLIAWFTYPAISTLKFGLEVRKEGLGYQSVHWQTSETLAYVRQAREELLQLHVYTNDPEGLYFLTKIRAGRLSIQFHPNWPEAGRAYLICFKQGYLGDCLEILDRLHQNPEIRPVAEFSDGTIYLVTRRNLQVPSPGNH
ncbi:ArnT family glycosyltransferase [Chloracidobacterium thermophilum]|uniref:ArnT family glycosyltransferase n=1 Tax=Chloracidobacterium thermophilum TaxID=458033 RepID=UPI0011D1DA97|nr:hypothetical protein [Chloracidobacterium thermophilum]QUV78161.1 hypothetical protein J8C08_08625 [Chloracidobacterium thermophilum]